MSKRVLLLLALAACETTKAPRPSDRSHAGGNGSECLTVTNQKGDDWSFCNLSGVSYFCTDDGCLPLLCATSTPEAP